MSIMWVFVLASIQLRLLWIIWLGVVVPGLAYTSCRVLFALGYRQAADDYYYLARYGRGRYQRTVWSVRYSARSSDALRWKGGP